MPPSCNTVTSAAYLWFLLIARSRLKNDCNAVTVLTMLERQAVLNATISANEAFAYERYKKNAKSASIFMQKYKKCDENHKNERYNSQNSSNEKKRLYRVSQYSLLVSES